MKYITLLLLLLCSFTYGQKIKYTVNNGLQIEGVDQTNPVLYDNDIIHDTPEVHYLWLRANRGEVKLVGNIATRDMHPQGESKAKHWPRWTEFYDKAIAAGLKNIPRPIQGAGGTGAAGQHLTKPASGNIDETAFQNNAGSDLIISEAHKASAAKPLVIFVGGNVSTVANAYLKDKSIADKVVVLHYAGYVTPGGTYNTMDKWSTYVVMKRMKYVVVSGDQYSYYNGQMPVPTTINTSGMPNNPFTKTLVENWIGQYYARYKNMGDAPATLYFFNHGIIKNVVRKLENGSTTTSDTFDFLLVSQTDWAWLKSHAMMDYIRNPANHVPGSGTVPPPINSPPTVTTTMGALFNAGDVILTASASDSDGTVSKVEFLVNGSKVGEDTSSPYSLVQTFVPGSYGIQARAIDNLGAVGNSPTLIITVVGPTEPPDSTDCIVCPAGPQGPKGDQGEPGICPNCPPSGGGTAVSKTYDVTIYGAKGDGNTDDTQAFQRAFNDAAIGSGKVIIPSPSSFYKLTNTINVRPPSGQGQVKVSVEAWGGPNRIRYMGASNKAVFYIAGIKNCIWSGFGIEVASGISGVTVIDLDTESATISSSTGTKFDTYRINLGDGNNNVAFRIGHNRAAVGNDISNILWMNGAVYGNNKPGQVAYLNEGHNTLHLQFLETFTAFCDKFFSNSGPAGRGNGGVNFFGCGGSQNNMDYDLNFEQQYTIVGGTWELGKVFLRVPDFAQVSPNIMVQNVSIKNYSDSDGLIQVNVPANLTLQNVYMMQSDRGAYSNPVVVRSSQGVGSLVMTNCTLSTNNEMPYQKVAGSWRVTSFGNTRFNTTTGSVVQNKEFFPGEFDVAK